MAGIPKQSEPTNLAPKKMRLRFFNSFQEANADAARQSPLERLKEAVELILCVYGVTQEQLNKRDKKLHIKIISYK